MFAFKINDRIQMRLIEQSHGPELWRVIEANRAHLRHWHPWVDYIRCQADIERLITGWLHQMAANRGFQAGVWHDGLLCGAIGHLNIDWSNRCTWFSYWLAEAYQSRGIMTAACQAFVTHAFSNLNLNRITIECASADVRGCRVPEHLGFTLEGISRGVEWLHDHFADHAMYGLLRDDALQDHWTRSASLPAFGPTPGGHGAILQ